MSVSCREQVEFLPGSPPACGWLQGMNGRDGYALLRRGEPMTAKTQRANVPVAAAALAAIHPGNELVITHGNGPQTGLLALQGAAYNPDKADPLDGLGAQSEGTIGYMIEQELDNLLPIEAPFATILTMVELARGARRSLYRADTGRQIAQAPRRECACRGHRALSMILRKSTASCRRVPRPARATPQHKWSD